MIKAIYKHVRMCMLFILICYFVPSYAQTFSVNPTVNHVYNGISLGSISLSSDSPSLSYSWSNGDSSNSIDSLIAGAYSCTVSFDGDTLVKDFSIGYYPTWDTLIKTSSLLKGGVQSDISGNNMTEGYAYSLNTLSTDSDGWYSFHIDSGSIFSGAVGMINNTYFDQSSDGSYAVGIIDSTIIILGVNNGDGFFFGNYEPAKAYTFIVNSIGDSIIVTKDVFDGSIHTISTVSFYYPRIENVSLAFIPFNPTAQVKESACSFTPKLRTRINVIPGIKGSKTVSLSANSKGGQEPLTYIWSNGANTESVINVPMGEYIVTVVDAEGTQNILKQFGGQYVNWDTLTQVTEGMDLSLNVSSSNNLNGEGDDFSSIYGIAYGKNRLQSGTKGSVKFELTRGADFSGAIGLIHSLDMDLGGFGLMIIPKEDWDGEGARQRLIIPMDDNPISLGGVPDSLPLSIIIKREDDTIYVFKNSVMVYSAPLNIYMPGMDLTPDLTPAALFFSTPAKIGRITCDFGERPMAIKSTITHCVYSSDGISLGNIHLDYDTLTTYSWSNGATGNNIDSLNPGNYSCTVIGNGDTVINHFNIGYYPTWDTLVKITALIRGGVQSSISGNSDYEGYAFSLNTLPIDSSGWYSFQINPEDTFQGLVGLIKNTNFDQTDEGSFGIVFIENSLAIAGVNDDWYYWGHYEPNMTYQCTVKVIGDSIFFTKRGIDESFHYFQSTVGFYRPRNQNLSLSYIPLRPLSKVSEIACSFKPALRSKLNVFPGAKGSGTTSLSVSTKGGQAPYTYAWSNGDSTISIPNVLAGEYIVTVTDANGSQDMCKGFAGQYSSWDTLYNTHETAEHSLMISSQTAFSTEGSLADMSIYGFAYSKNRLHHGANGSVNYEWSRGADFSGAIGLVPDMSLEGGGMGLAILPNEEESNQQIIFMNGDNPVNLGEVYDSLPISIRIQKKDNIVYLYKNNILVYSLSEGDISGTEDGLPDVSPNVIFTKINAHIGRVTCDFSERTFTIMGATVTHCQPDSTGFLFGSISFDFDSLTTYSWSNGDSTNSIDSLVPGDYFCTVTQNGDTIVQSFNIGYYPNWDTLVKINALVKGGLESTITTSSAFNPDGYAKSLNALSPGNSGWASFQINAGDTFSGILGMVNNLNFDETSDESIAVAVLENNIIILGGNEDGIFFGNYDPSETYKFALHFNEGSVYVTKDIFSGSEHYFSAVRLNNIQTQNLFIAVVPGNYGKVREIASSFTPKLRLHLTVVPGAKGSNTTSLFPQIKGGKAPYTFSWSNGSTSNYLSNVITGEYALTVNDIISAQASIKQFAGQYVSWDTLIKTHELVDFSLSVDGDDTSGGEFTGIAYGKNRLSAEETGSVNFEWAKGADFSGSIGIVHDLDSGEGFGLTVMPKEDWDGFGASQNLFTANDNPVNLGPVFDSMPFTIRIWKGDDSIYVYKNNLLVYSSSQNAITGTGNLSDVSPAIFFTKDQAKVGKVTCDFDTTSTSVMSANITVLPATYYSAGVVDVQPTGGKPPYKIEFGNNDTVNLPYPANYESTLTLLGLNIDSLNISKPASSYLSGLEEGTYTVSITDFDNVRIHKQYEIGKQVGFIHSDNYALSDERHGQSYNPTSNRKYANQTVLYNIANHTYETVGENDSIDPFLLDSAYIKVDTNLVDILNKSKSDAIPIQHFYPKSDTMVIKGAFGLGRKLDAQTKAITFEFNYRNLMNDNKLDIAVANFQSFYSTNTINDFLSYDSLEINKSAVSSLFTINNEQIKIWQGEAYNTLASLNPKSKIKFILSSSSLQILIDDHLVRKVFNNFSNHFFCGIIKGAELNISKSEFLKK